MQIEKRCERLNGTNETCGAKNHCAGESSEG